MLAAMSPQQFDEWVAMYAIRPWGIELPIEDKQEGGSSLDVFRGMAGF